MIKKYVAIDQSYFSVIAEDAKGQGIDLASQVISFDVTEEVRQFLTGSITLRDPQGVVTRMLQAGRMYVVEFGYLTNRNFRDNPKEQKAVVRRGMNCLIVNPGGSADNRGVKTTTVRFQAGVWSSDARDIQTFYGKTKGDIIKAIMMQMGITVQLVRFKAEYDKADGVLQQTTGFRFLCDKSFEWRAQFAMGSMANGQYVGLFCDAGDKATIARFTQLSTGATYGSSKYLEYGEDSVFPNVKSYTWKNNFGENGKGDGVSLNILDGQVVMTRRVVEDGYVKVMKLNMDRVRKYVDVDSAGALERTAAVLNTANYESEIVKGIAVSYFFDCVGETTAPQGCGFEFTVEMIGDPSMTGYSRVQLANGFPVELQTNDPYGLSLNQADESPAKYPGIDFFVRKVTHKIDSSGYSMSLEIGDTFSVFGGYVQ